MKTHVPNINYFYRLGFSSGVRLYKNPADKNSLYLVHEFSPENSDLSVTESQRSGVLAYRIATKLGCQVMPMLISDYSPESKKEIEENSAKVNDEKSLRKLFGELDNISVKSLNMDEDDEEYDENYMEHFKTYEIIDAQFSIKPAKQKIR